MSKYLTIGDGKYQDKDFYQKVLTSRNIKFKKKKTNINGLQLSDILSNPLRKYTLIRHRKMKKPSEELFWMELVRTSMPKIDCRKSDGKIDGYGLVFIK